MNPSDTDRLASELTRLRDLADAEADAYQQRRDRMRQDLGQEPGREEDSLTARVAYTIGWVSAIAHVRAMVDLVTRYATDADTMNRERGTLMTRQPTLNDITDIARALRRRARELDRHAATLEAYVLQAGLDLTDDTPACDVGDVPPMRCLAIGCSADVVGPLVSVCWCAAHVPDQRVR